jgi:hypothetical protein
MGVIICSFCSIAKAKKHEGFMLTGNNSEEWLVQATFANHLQDMRTALKLGQSSYVFLSRTA